MTSEKAPEDEESSNLKQILQDLNKAQTKPRSKKPKETAKPPTPYPTQPPETDEKIILKQREIVAALLSQGANTYLQNKKQLSPFTTAALMQRWDLAELMIDEERRRNLRSPTSEKYLLENRESKKFGHRRMIENFLRMFR